MRPSSVWATNNRTFLLPIVASYILVFDTFLLNPFLSEKNHITAYAMWFTAIIIAVKANGLLIQIAAV